MIDCRTANKEDLAQILELYRQLIPEEEPISPDEAIKIWEEAEEQNIKYFVVTDNGKVVASCYLAIIPNLTRQGRPVGFIENVITDQKHRRKGAGRKLIDTVTAYSKEHNCCKVILQSGLHRKESHIFYEECGFDGGSKKAFEKRFHRKNHKTH